MNSFSKAAQLSGFFFVIFENMNRPKLKNHILTSNV